MFVWSKRPTTNREQEVPWSTSNLAPTAVKLDLETVSLASATANKQGILDSIQVKRVHNHFTMLYLDVIIYHTFRTLDDVPALSSGAGVRDGLQTLEIGHWPMNDLECDVLPYIRLHHVVMTPPTSKSGS